MAGGIIARLKANGLAGKVPITGQDASVEGLQQILAGNQCMTVYKNTDLEAGLASKLAIDLIKVTRRQPTRWRPAASRTRPRPAVPSALATPEAIFKNNVKKVSTTASRQARTSVPGRTPSMHASRHQLTLSTRVPASGPAPS